MRIFYSIISLLLILTVGCHRQEHDPRLLRVADLAEHSYEEALTALDSIDPKELSTGDRHFYDLLTIKANDKNYNTHTSDSLILDVISYYENHKDDPYYPEALYYGGRVYSDLGDYPTSLKYFQKSLDNIPDATNQLPFKRRVLSQTGRLLDKLRLFNEATPYIDQAAQANALLKDTLNLVYDLHLLGVNYMRGHDYEAADSCFSTALPLSKSLNDTLVSETNMYLAAVRFRKGEFDTARMLIKDVPGKVDRLSMNTALAYATEIYTAAGIMDTGCMYAEALIHSDYITNKQIGYQTLLSPEAGGYVTPDSLDAYTCQYRSLLKTLHNENENQLALTQQSLYNYQLHEREKVKAIRDKSNLIILLIAAAFLIAVLVASLLYIKYKNQRQIIRLQQALEYINRLKLEYKGSDVIDITPVELSAEESLREHQEKTETVPSGLSIQADTAKSPTEESLREQLRTELLSLSEMSPNVPGVPGIILQSDVYINLREMIQMAKPIPETDRTWIDLQQLIGKTYPNFISRLNLLTSGHLKKRDLRTALLIKCGFTPSEIAILIGRDKATVTYRRNMIGKMIFDDKVDPKTTDNIIRLL